MVVWGKLYQNELDKLERIQIDSMRLITGATARCNVLNLYKETNMVPVLDRINNSVLIQMFKIINNLSPSYLSDLISVTGDRQQYRLRSFNPRNVTEPITRLESYRRSFVPYGCSLWNNLPSDMKEITSVNTFKDKLKSKFDSCRTLYYYGERWAGIHHARLRIGCSKLNYDLNKNLHVIDSPQCLCGALQETAFHFFFECPNFINERNLLLAQIDLIANPTVDIVLFGDTNLEDPDNVEIFQAVHTFIRESKRFE